MTQVEDHLPGALDISLCSCWARLSVCAVVFITLGLVFAAFVFTAGRFLARHRRYSFCLTRAGSSVFLSDSSSCSCESR